MQLAILLFFQFLGIVLILIPLTFHIRHRNAAVICLCLFLSSNNLIYFINGIVWNAPTGPDSPLLKGYCDISGRILNVQGPCLLGSAIAILRQLARILSPSGSVSTGRSKTRQTVIDLATIFTIPLLATCLNLVLFREPRYTIYQYAGCYPALIFWSPLNLITSIWWPVMAVVGAYYSIVIIYLLNKKRKAFREIIKNSTSGLDINRFIRLLSLALLSVAVALPLILYSFAVWTQHISWDSDYKPFGSFSTIVVYPSSGRLSHSSMWSQWVTALFSIACAGIFGIGREAFNNYRTWFYRVPGSRGAVACLSRSRGRVSDQVSEKWSLVRGGRARVPTPEAAPVRRSPKTLEVIQIEPVYTSEGSSDDSSSGSSDRSSPRATRQSELSSPAPTRYVELQAGTSQTRVWRCVDDEADSASLLSPSKIKVKSDVTQESARKSQLHGL